MKVVGVGLLITRSGMVQGQEKALTRKQEGNYFVEAYSRDQQGLKRVGRKLET